MTNLYLSVRRKHKVHQIVKVGRLVKLHLLAAGSRLMVTCLSFVSIEF